MSKVYQIITDRIVSLLEGGTVPWQRPWSTPNHKPRNFASGKEYRGINVFLLNCAGFDSPYWLTWKQAHAKGATVRTGERYTPCIFWTEWETEDRQSGREVKIPVLRFYKVWNAAQIDGIDFPAVSRPEGHFEPIAACESVVAGMPKPPGLEHRGNQACYQPATDTVLMPDGRWFKTPEEYHSTLFHELTHATGHESRLARKGITEPIRFGSRTYSKEELVAEMGAAFLCGHVGIENRTLGNSAAYLAGWLRALRGDPRMVVLAAAAAQKAADYILAKTWED